MDFFIYICKNNLMIMIQVWKCDFCSHTNINPEEVKNHEPKCSFNKVNKKCFTCKFSYEEGWDYHMPGCEIGLNTFDGEEKGNCSGWVNEHLEEERDKKITDLLDGFETSI